MEVKPIGVIHTPFKEARGTPIQPRMAQGAEGTVEVFPEYVDGLKDIGGFERIWLLYWFDRAPASRLVVTPFMDDVPRGLFSTRAPCRPNPIGISCVRLVEAKGGLLKVSDVDMLDGTPLVDIKPYTARFDHWEVSRNGWLDEPGVNRRTADDRFSTGDRSGEEE